MRSSAAGGKGMERIILLAAAILGFLFPAELIDALRATEEKKARDAREKPVSALVSW